ncbi:MAG TPA: cellulase family glycosylhydrolase [Terracidiphilus sp.]|nr:cellulase family glycosylhydrolase [Terracidiphilus sp.]
MRKSFFASSFLILTLLAPAFCSAQSQSATGGCSPQAAPALPLHTSGRWIVDRNGNRVKLDSVNWYGAEEKDFVPAGLELASLDSIASEIRCMGFNSVRLPWSNQLVETNPVISNAAVAANPQFDGMHAMDVFDAVVQSLAKHGLMIILDNHMSNANWCCGNTDGNTLWYNAQYPESSWLADWQSLAGRYLNQPMVIGADLRNEPRYNATWGGDPSTDWHAAAQRGGNAVLSVNPNLLIFVEGVSYAGDLTGVAQLPVVLDLPGHLVYEAHNYPWYQSFSTYSQLAQNLNNHWGYILTPDQPYTAPVWVGEFGTCHTTVSCFQSSTAGTNGFWLGNFLQYLAQNDVDWSFWAVNGTEASGSGRVYGSEETYGILDPYWNAPALADQIPSPTVNLLGMLQADIGPTQGPGVQPGNPVVALTNPVNDSLYAFGNSITLSADAAAPGGQVQQVSFYADGSPVGAATSAPFTVQWTGASSGKHRIVAVATSNSGSTYTSSSAPVSIFVENYSARDVQYGPAIGIDFVGYWGSAPGTPMASSEVAGAVPESYWNNAYGNSGAVSSLIDSTGSTTPASVDWSSTNMYSLSIQDAPGNNRMMKGYQDNSNTRPTLIHVNNIPASFSSYDVYVYFDGANGSKARAANYRIVTTDSNGNSSGCPQGILHSGTILSGLDAPNTDFSGSFTLAAGGSAGNYVLFPNCHGTNFTLLPVHGASSDSQYRAPVNGIQIVSIPN